MDRFRKTATFCNTTNNRVVCEDIKKEYQCKEVLKQ